jgi:hypothetical protein
MQPASAWAASIRIAWFSLGGPHDLGRPPLSWARSPDG